MPTDARPAYTVDGSSNLHGGPPVITRLERAVFARVDPGYEVGAHLHHFHQLDLLLSGRFDVRLEDRRTVRLQIGDAFLTPPLVRHAYHAPQPAEFVVFKFHVAPRYWPAFGNRPQRERLSQGLTAVAGEWARDFADQTQLWQQRTNALLTMCLVSMVRVEPDAHNAALEGLDSFRQSLWPLLERIENEPYTDWSISDLAEETHLSTPHFSRCFRRLLDKTPKQYLIETRMRAAAAELIADPPKAIKQISRRAGYADIHTFTHAFGHFFGISPGAYRRHAARL